MKKILFHNIIIPCQEQDSVAFAIVQKKLKSIGVTGDCTFYIHRRSVDARRRDQIKLVLSVVAITFQ